MISQKPVEVVRSLLRQAFRSTGCYELDFSHEDAVHWRENLYLLKPKDLQRVLPLVLEDLLCTHTEDPYNPMGADLVVEHLNVLCEESSESSRDTLRHLGMTAFNYDYETRKNQRKMKLKSYARFTHEQALAILKWLELAQSWRCFSYFGGEDIRFAISYWKQRSQSARE